MLGERLGKEWRARRALVAVDAIMRFSDDGLVVGAGTVLAPAGESGRDVSIDPLEPRLRALLAAAHLRRPTVGDLAHLRKAAERWSQGDETLATMHLALSRLDRLEQPEADAHRIFLADGLLKGGIDADAIIDAIVSGVPLTSLRKYSPDQPRVPAGSGATSGEWTTAGGGSSINSPADSNSRSVVRPASASAPEMVPEADQSPQIAQWPQPEVNPSTITHIAQPYSGPDACYRAKVDCYRNTIEESFSHGQANDNWNKWQQEELLRCRMAEAVCETVGFVVEKTPIVRRGAVIYPDRGVVISEKGWSDYLYIPAPARGRIPPMRRSL